MSKFLIISMLIAPVLFVPRAARAWGQYGHEQINHAAIGVLVTTAGDSEEARPLVACFKSAQVLITRLAITPDMDWKMIGNNSNLSPEDRRKKTMADHYEHPLHFFEADAFTREPTPDNIATLPAGEYFQVFARYKRMLAANADYVTKIDPSKRIADPSNPTPAEVTAHGTAPWRILQLYDLSVKALKEGDLSRALLYLGAVGHYVGDMSQPFHASLNFDGDAYKAPASGIHHAFEEGILEDAAKRVHASRDSHLLWSSFAATESTVMDAAVRSFNAADPLNRDRLVPEVLKLVGSGYPLAEELLKSFSEQCAAAQAGKIHAAVVKKGGRVVAANFGERSSGPFCVRPADHKGQPRVGEGVQHAFMDAKIDTPSGGQMSVLEAADVRMGSSAALLARLWIAAYREAGRPQLGDCGAVSFEDVGVLDNYPKPAYLPPSN